MFDAPPAIEIHVGDQVMTATLDDSQTAREFVALLPLHVTMNDLFRREKFAHLPQPISEAGKRKRSYEVGELVYWPPGPDVAIFYRHDGQAIPAPGIIVIGKITTGLGALTVPGAIDATIQAAAASPER